MAIKHIVFDWDGTLADTYPVISAGYEYAFKSLNMQPISYDEIKRITSSKQNKDTMGFIFGDKKEQAKKAYYEYITLYHTAKLKLMPNADKLLQFCHDSNIKIYLITNKRRKFIIEETDKLKLTKFFDNIVAAGDFAEDKPHPIATQAVFQNQQPNPNEILVVGDGMADYNTARTYDKEGLKTKCAIYDPTGKYTGEKPDYIIKDLLDVIHIIDKNS